MNFILKRNEGQKILKRNKKNNPSDEMKDKWLFRLIPSSKDIVNGIRGNKRKQQSTRQGFSKGIDCDPAPGNQHDNISNDKEEHHLTRIILNS